MKTVGITACSNPQKERNRAQNERLISVLEKMGNRVLLSSCIYEQDRSYAENGQERAAELMKLFANPEVSDIYDISGGDMASAVLDWLDYGQIQKSRAVFWGYSDLTVILNAIYTQTGKSSVLYQIRNLTGDYEELQCGRYQNPEALFSPVFRMVQGQQMEGIVVGGNIRCFLKLAGTPYFPDLTGKILLLEAMSGGIPQITSFLSQLRSCGAFQKISGILLGTFCEMEDKNCCPDVLTLIRSFAGSQLPIAVTAEIGHRQDSRAVRIGERIRISTAECSCTIPE